MKKEELKKWKNLEDNSALKNIEIEKELSNHRSQTYVANCFKALVVPIVFVLLLSGEVKEAIYFTVGCFFIFPILNQLEKLLRDEWK